MATKTFQNEPVRTRGRRRKLSVAAVAVAALSLAAMGPASAQNQGRSGGLLGIDLGLDLSGQGPLIDTNIDLGGLLGTGSGAQVVVTADPGSSGIAGVDVTAGVGSAAQADISAVIGGESLVEVQADATVANVDATASVGVLDQNGSIANACADVRIGTARCGANGDLLGLGVTDVLGVNGLALVDGLTGNGLASACLDLTLGAPTTCAAAVAPPADPDPDGPGVPGPGDPTPGTPGIPTDPVTDPTIDPGVLHAFQPGDDVDARDGTLDRRQVAALAFTGLSVAGLVTLGVASIGGGTLLTRLRRRTPVEDLAAA